MKTTAEHIAHAAAILDTARRVLEELTATPCGGLVNQTAGEPDA